MANAKAQERIARGQCPRCGEEAAPYYLCPSCRLNARLGRALNKGANLGVFEKEKRGRTTHWRMGDKPENEERYRKYGTDIILPETDKRSHPRLNNTRVDVDEMLVEIIRYVGRPCTVDEIKTVWGRLRQARKSPLPRDLANLLIAQDKRKTRQLKRIAQGLA